MPLVPVNEDVRIKSEGAQPLLVFADEGRSMGLIVDEIVDIVEEELSHRARQPAARRARLGGGQGPGHRGGRHRALPAAGIRGLDGLGRGAKPTRAPLRVLLIDDAPFFRNMLAPVLKAAGYAVTSSASGQEALGAVDGGEALRRRGDRYRDARHGRLRFDVGGARQSAHGE